MAIIIGYYFIALVQLYKDSYKNIHSSHGVCLVCCVCPLGNASRKTEVCIIVLESRRFFFQIIFLTVNHNSGTKLKWLLSTPDIMNLLGIIILLACICICCVYHCKGKLLLYTVTSCKICISLYIYIMCYLYYNCL